MSSCWKKAFPWKQDKTLSGIQLMHLLQIKRFVKCNIHNWGIEISFHKLKEN